MDEGAEGFGKVLNRDVVCLFEEIEGIAYNLIKLVNINRENVRKEGAQDRLRI